MKGYIKSTAVLLFVASLFAILFTAVAIRASINNEPVLEDEGEVIAHKVKLMTIKPGLDLRFTVQGDVTVGQLANLTAERRSSVQDVYVKAGDAVHEGDILALLHSESLDTSVLSAQLMFTNAQSNLSTTRTIAANQIESERVRLETAELEYANLLAENAVRRKESEARLASTKLSYDLSVQEAKSALESAQKNLTNTKAVNEANKLVAETSLMNTIRSLETVINSGLNTSNELLNIDSAYRGNGGIYTDILGQRNADTKTEAERALEKAIASFEARKETYESMKVVARDSEEAFDLILELLNFTIPTGELTQPILQNYIMTMTQDLSNVRNGIASLESAQASLLSITVSNSVSLSAAEREVIRSQNTLNSVSQLTADGQSQIIATAEAQHQTLLTQLASAVASARKRLESARLAYANAQNSGDLSILSAEQALAGARDSLNQLQISRNDLTIRSPLNGIIRSVSAKVGDELNAGSPIAIIENQETVIVVAQLTSEQLLLVQTGDEVRIGSGFGYIQAIAQSADPMTKTYRVEVTPDGTSVRPGEFVELEFATANQINSQYVYLPISVVHLSPEENYVWTVVEGKTKKQAIILGEIRGNMVEIANGLAAGQQIIGEGGRIIEDEGLPVEVIE